MNAQKDLDHSTGLLETGDGVMIVTMMVEVHEFVKKCRGK